jgi:hypothetical protein
MKKIRRSLQWSAKERKKGNVILISLMQKSRKDFEAKRVSRK